MHIFYQITSMATSVCIVVRFRYRYVVRVLSIGAFEHKNCKTCKTLIYWQHSHGVDKINASHTDAIKRSKKYVWSMIQQPLVLTYLVRRWYISGELHAYGAL